MKADSSTFVLLTFVSSSIPHLENGPLRVLSFHRVLFFFSTYTTCLLSPAAAVTLPTFPAVSGGLISDQKQLCFCLPACDWKDSAGSESPAVALEGNLSHLCTKHVTAQPRQCEKQWKKRKGTLITFLSLMLTLSPSLLISQASVFLWTLKGVFTLRLWLISHPFIWYRVQCRLCRFKKKKERQNLKWGNNLL